MIWHTRLGIIRNGIWLTFDANRIRVGSGDLRTNFSYGSFRNKWIGNTEVTACFVEFDTVPEIIVNERKKCGIVSDHEKNRDRLFSLLFLFTAKARHAPKNRNPESTEKTNIESLRSEPSVPRPRYARMLVLASHLSTQRVRRAGVIPFCVRGAKMYFLLAKHSETEELGDFGGGVRKRECVLHAALREFREESRGIFGISSFEKEFALVDSDRNMAIVFVRLHESWFEKAGSAFALAPSITKTTDEISGVEWVDEAKFMALVRRTSIEKTKMWRRVRAFFHRAMPTVGVFTESLRDSGA